MPDRPIVSNFAERVYTMMEPVTHDDDSLYWPLLSYIAAIANSFKPIDDAAAGGDNGEPPFYLIMHPDTCPSLVLPWLGQFVGIRFDPNLNEQQQRDAIRNKESFSRGSPEAMKSAIATWLTGSKTVTLRERNPTPYSMTIVLRSDEVLPEDLPSGQLHIWPAILSQKPAGLIVTLSILDGLDYQMVFEENASYAEVFTKYATYNGMLNGQPGT